MSRARRSSDRIKFLREKIHNFIPYIQTKPGSLVEPGSLNAVAKSSRPKRLPKSSGTTRRFEWRHLWHQTQRNARIRTARAWSQAKSIAARNAKRWRIRRILIALARIRNAAAARTERAI